MVIPLLLYAAGGMVAGLITSYAVTELTDEHAKKLKDIDKRAEEIKRLQTLEAEKAKSAEEQLKAKKRLLELQLEVYKLELQAEEVLLQAIQAKKKRIALETSN